MPCLLLSHRLPFSCLSRRAGPTRTLKLVGASSPCAAGRSVASSPLERPRSSSEDATSIVSCATTQPAAVSSEWARCLFALSPVAAVAPLLLLMPLPAWADELVAAETVVAVIPLNASEVLVAFFFYTVVALLTVVTAGVAYLALTQSLDKKQEMEDKQELGRRLKPKPGTKKDEKTEAELVEAGRKSARDRRDKSKGFGSSDDK